MAGRNPDPRPRALARRAARRPRPDRAPVQDGSSTRLTYREYAQRVEQFAGALRELGVGPGEVVAIHLPNIWQLPPLLLAAFHVGATLAPIIPTLRSRELERVLRRVGASVVITMDPASLAEMAPRLPQLRHRVVVGRRIEPDEVDFGKTFEHSPHSLPLADTAADPDRVGLILFTSGTTGAPKAALHTLNTQRPYPLAVASGVGFTPDTGRTCRTSSRTALVSAPSSSGRFSPGRVGSSRTRGIRSRCPISWRTKPSPSWPRRPLSSWSSSPRLGNIPSARKACGT
nr:AMP-binding protein [Kibdelosporangium philippinense]